MGKKKTTTANTYGSPAPFSSPATVALQGMVAQGSDPTIPYAYAQKRQDQQNTFQNPLGAYTTPAVRDAQTRVSNERSSMDEASAIQGSNFRAKQMEFQRQLGVVGATQPFQTGGTQTQSGGGLGAILGAGAQVGSAALAKGCWVAEVIYGVDDIRTHIMRSWLNTEVLLTRIGRFIMAFYLTFGQQIAKLVRYSPKLRQIVKDQIFDKALPHAISAINRR